jgi:ATP-dependent Clp protease adaptor protein ClpS
LAEFRAISGEIGRRVAARRHESSRPDARPRLVLPPVEPYKASVADSGRRIPPMPTPNDPDQRSDQPGHSLVVEEAEPQVKKPPLYQVILLNDDYTPMEFVVDVLERIFGLDRPKATRIMLEVHTRGKGVCGVFTFEIAETKVAQVTTYARQHQHPLLCTMEEA